MMAGGRYLDRFTQGGAPKAWLMFAIVAVTMLAIFRPTFARSAATRTSRVVRRSIAFAVSMTSFGN
jgi:hypothetical protein